MLIGELTFSSLSKTQRVCKRQRKLLKLGQVSDTKQWFYALGFSNPGNKSTKRTSYVQIRPKVFFSRTLFDLVVGRHKIAQVVGYRPMRINNST